MLMRNTGNDGKVENYQTRAIKKGQSKQRKKGRYKRDNIKVPIRRTASFRKKRGKVRERGWQRSGKGLKEATNTKINVAQRKKYK